MTDNAKLLFNYLKDNYDIHVTAADIANDTGLKTSSVNLLFNNFVSKGWAKRTNARVQLEDGTETSLKFLKLTEAGLQINPDNE